MPRVEISGQHLACKREAIVVKFVNDIITRPMIPTNFASSFLGPSK